MEQVIAKAFEYTLVGGAFVYLLMFVTKTITAALADNALKNASIVESLVRVSETLTRLDSRMEKMEGHFARN